MTQQICKKSGQPFLITKEDEDFYQKMKVPLPTLCPEERQRRRLAWRNERTLYKRKCSGSGKTIIGMYPENTPFPVFDHNYFFSDKWNALDYGREFDFNRPFFDQFHELMQVVPRMRNHSVGNDNAEYGNLSSWSKDCYMLFESDNNRDCYYLENSFRCVNTCDCGYAKECELCYQCLDIKDSYNLRYCLICKNCSDSWFLKNCIGCKQCFGCVNLRNKEFYFLNERLTKEQYMEKINSIKLESFESIQNLWKQFLEFAKKFPQKYINGFQNENCTGDYLNNCKDVHFCFDSSDLRDCKYVFHCERINNGYDVDTYGGEEGCQFVYECQSVGRGAFNVAFCNDTSRNIKDISYCETCWEGNNLFGCISLNHGEYCILNKKYTKEQYLELKKKIVEHMRAPVSAVGGRKTGEYGEFFPIKYSPFAYNETQAQIYYPLTKEEALQSGYKWKDHDPKEYYPQKIKIPDSIREVDDSICDEILACEKTGKNYKIQKAELDFYRKLKLPIPKRCPDQRYLDRLAMRNSRKLYERKCSKCQKDINTTFSPDRTEPVYCEECYVEATD